MCLSSVSSFASRIQCLRGFTLSGIVRKFTLLGWWQMPAESRLPAWQRLELLVTLYGQGSLHLFDHRLYPRAPPGTASSHIPEAADKSPPCSAAASPNSSTSRTSTVGQPPRQSPGTIESPCTPSDRPTALPSALQAASSRLRHQPFLHEHSNESAMSPTLDVMPPAPPGWHVPGLVILTGHHHAVHAGRNPALKAWIQEVLRLQEYQLMVDRGAFWVRPLQVAGFRSCCSTPLKA